MFEDSNEDDPMILIFRGIEISLMSRRTNTSLSNSVLFSLLLQIKYLSSLKMN